MFRRSLFRPCVLLAVFGIVITATGLRAQDDSDSSHRGRKYKAPPPAARIQVTVLKDVNGKPVENASVIFHPIEGDKDKGTMELKTNEDGKAIIDVIPIGDTVRLQIIATGYQTYGQDYKVDKDEMSMEVRLKRPGAQYSLYNQKSADSGSDNKSQNPPASGDKSSGSGSQSNSQPDQGQPKSNSN